MSTAKSLSILGSAFLVATLALNAAPAFAQAAQANPAKQTSIATPSQQPQTRIVEWREDRTKYSYALQLSDSVLAALRTNPVADSVQGGDLVDALIERGAILNDVTNANGTVTPAVQEFDAQSGRRTKLEHYTNGKLENTPAGEPAIIHFSPETGNRFIIEYFKNGERHNPAPGVAAQQYFDPTKPDSKPYILLFYENGKLNDPAPNVPARQWYDIPTGHVRQLAHYDHGAFLDPPNGDAALREYDVKTGHLTVAQRYQRGRPQDSPAGDAAWKLFDGETGALLEQRHHQNRLLQDTNGEPAWQKFDRQTGRVVWAERYANGVSQGVLNATELKALNDKRSGAAPAPQTFKPSP